MLVKNGKTKQITFFMILITIAIMIAPACSYFSAQNVETVEDAIDSLQEIGQTIRIMDNSLDEHTGNNDGQDIPGNVSGFGDICGANGR